MKSIVKATALAALILFGASGTVHAQTAAQEHQRFMDAVAAKRAAQAQNPSQFEDSNTPYPRGYRPINKGVVSPQGSFCPEVEKGYVCPEGFVPKRR